MKRTAMNVSNPRELGFTLMELLVALTLAAVISLLISIVGTQAQELYRVTTAQVEVYQKFRYALTDLQKHLENWEVTTDLEFFIDKAADRNEHWDQGEEIQDPDNLSGGMAGKYDEGAHIVERQYTLLLGGGEIEEEHDSFRIYFKAPTVIDGQIRMANIEYFLARPNPDPDPDDETGGIEPIPLEVDSNKNFVLMKVIRYVDLNNSDFFSNKLEVEVIVTELCRNVTDLKFEYYYDNPFDSRPGAFYSPRSEREAFGGKTETSIDDDRSVEMGTGLRKTFLYGGVQDFGPLSQGEAVRGERNTERSEYTPVSFSVGRGTSVKFSQLGFGDQIYIWSNVGGGDFPDGNYHLYRNDSGRLEFFEKVDSSTWEGNVGNLRFRAGYVPSSLRIRMRVLNDDGQEPRYLQVVVHPFRKK